MEKKSLHGLTKTTNLEKTTSMLCCFCREKTFFELHFYI